MNARIYHEQLTIKDNSVAAMLEEIASDANSLRRTFMDMEGGGIMLEGSSLTIFRVFAEKIGWMSELALKQITGSTTIVGDAEDWLLSPAAVSAVRALEEKPHETENKAPTPENPVHGILGMLLAMNQDEQQKLLNSLIATANQSAQAAGGAA